MDLDSRTTWLHPLLGQAWPQDLSFGVLEGSEKMVGPFLL